ncbi:uncharacterized protein LOC135107575 [Scylla paramamosain]|uniref:uncharacterized protein LOC135107575 n=1 Tax=Scylla paramamosain TaxID=85552 RepID=UPI003082F28B
MVMCKVVPACKEADPPKPCEDVDPPPQDCKTSHILVVLFIMFLAGIAGACVVVGGVLLYSCYTIMLIDIWLIVHGVSALGALVGLMVWSSKMSNGSFVNGPKIFALLLIFLNFTWLILGNAFIIGAYLTCGTVTFLGTISCSSSFLHFTLVIIIIFDIAYITFFVLLCIACSSDNGVQGWTHPALGESGCCARPSCFSSFYCVGKTPSWQEWIIIIALICYTLLAVTAIALGSAFINICDPDLWVPYWLIVHGAVTLVIFCSVLCCLVYPGWVTISWDRTQFAAFLPVLIFGLFQLIWLTFGNVRAAEYRINSCPVGDICNDGLHVFTLVLIFLLDLPFLVIIYVGIVLFILMTLLIIFKSCYDCCHKVDQDTAEPDEEKAERSSSSSSSTSSDSSDSE